MESVIINVNWRESGVYIPQKMYVYSSTVKANSLPLTLPEFVFRLSVFYNCSITDAAPPQFLPPTLLLYWVWKRGKHWLYGQRGQTQLLQALLAWSICFSHAFDCRWALPSRSSCSKLVPCCDLAPPWSTTASSSHRCETHWQKHYDPFL